MKLFSLLKSLGGSSLQRKRLFAIALAATAVSTSGLSLQADEVAFDTFDTLTLKGFDLANTFPAVGDGTDYLRTIPRWSHTFSGNVVPNATRNSPTGHSGELAYEGGAAMDVNSWIQEQGSQIGRQRTLAEGGLFDPNVRNTALIFDPDGWDDFNGGPNTDYNSYQQTSIDVTGVTTVNLKFDYQYAYEAPQNGRVEVSYDNGATWVVLLDLIGLPNDTIQSGPFIQDLTIPAGSASNLLVRFGIINAGNNWWFAIDNIEVRNVADASLLFSENFEGLALLPFGTVPNGGGANDGIRGQANATRTPPGDGTDFTQDITNWTIDNSLMGAVVPEGAFNGWSAIDTNSWVRQQGGQQRELFFGDSGVFPLNNTILVADGDAADDFVNVDPNLFNTFISRTYDLTNFDSRTLQFSFDFDTRVENNQTALAQASYDGGLTWTTMLRIKSGENGLVNGNQVNSELGPQLFVAGTDFDKRGSNKVTLRFGNVGGGNNWWSAVDNVKVEADPKTFVLGDANGDGFFDFGDLEPFVLALLDPATFATDFPTVNPDNSLDFDGDGLFTFGDIEGFTGALLGP